MQVSSVMARKLLTIRSGESIADAAKRMRDANVGCLVITTNSGAVQGIITDRDLVVRCVSTDDDTQLCPVVNHMSNPVITVSPAVDVLEAAHLMTEKKVKRLPVVEDGKLVGLVSLSDIALALEQPVQDLLLGMGAARRVAA